MNSIKGAIFDCDGTLFDSMQQWVWVEEYYARSIGLVPREGFLEAVRVFSSLEVAEYLRDEYGTPKSIEEIITGRNKIMEDFYFNKVTLKNGVVSFLETLRANGIRMCVATATGKYLVEGALRRCGIREYFERVFTCGEENTSKSSPEIFIRAAAFLGTEISETLVVEDALHAIRSAKSAGFQVAAVYDLSEEDNQGEVKSLSDYYCINMDELLFAN